MTDIKFDVNNYFFERPVKEVHDNITVLKSVLKNKNSNKIGYELQTPKLDINKIQGNFIELLLTKKEKHKLITNVISDLESKAIDMSVQESKNWFSKNFSYEQVHNMFRSIFIVTPDAFICRVPLGSAIDQDIKNQQIVCLIKIDGLIFTSNSCKLDLKVEQYELVSKSKKINFLTLKEDGSKEEFFEGPVSSNSINFIQECSNCDCKDKCNCSENNKCNNNCECITETVVEQKIVEPVVEPVVVAEHVETVVEQTADVEQIQVIEPTPAFVLDERVLSKQLDDFTLATVIKVTMVDEEFLYNIKFDDGQVFKNMKDIFVKKLDQETLKDQIKKAVSNNDISKVIELSTILKSLIKTS